MPDKFPAAALEDVHNSFAGALTPDKFSKVVKTGALPEDWALGQIVWSKTLGRPNAPRLSDGFSITASQLQYVGVDQEAHREVWLPRFFPASLWDGADDPEVWRVNFVVSHIPTETAPDGKAHVTTLQPSILKEVAWKDQPGPHMMKPPGASFIKRAGPVFLTFEVVPILLWKIIDGIAHP